MFTSIGYHTFAISKSLTQEEADILFKAFKRYMNRTKEICIMGPHNYEKDPFGWHYDIVYPGQYKGLTWKIRFSSRGFYTNGEFKPCSIKAIINPKVLTGEKSYIEAANASYLEKVGSIFDQEAEKISPMLRGFRHYSLNRIDYCINFDVSELKFDYPSELAKEIPELVMNLIKCGDIPDHFVEEYGNMYQLYLKSKSVVINCYWKHDDLIRNFSDCKDLEKSYDIIRFEVQFKYPKVFSKSAEIRRARERQKSILMKYIRKQGLGNFSEIQGGIEDDGKKQISETVIDIAQSDVAAIMEQMLSDEICSRTIETYFYKVMKKGDYYTYDAAKQRIESRVSKWEKVIRLETALQMVHEYGGIAKVKEALQEEELEEFRMSIRDLTGMGINPVTIPKTYGIEHIPNLLDNYFRLRAEEEDKIQEERERKQLIRDYIKDCKKRGIPWI